LGDDVTHATHLFSYRFKGRTYTVDIVAESADEAKERLKALAWAQYDGILVARLPQGSGPLTRIAVAVRNFLSARRRTESHS
jgi:hypothetical protein